MSPRACMENTKAHETPAVVTIGVLAHEHRRYGIVTADTKAQDEASND